MIKLKPLAVSLFIALGTGGFSALLTQGAMERYRELEQPPLSPPGWVFPVVWSALFVLMGIAAYLVWMRDSTGRNGALALYGLQLALNFCWTLIFFNLQNHALAFFWLLLLLGLVALMIRLFDRVSRTAAWLQLPYFFWLCFAAYLNLGVWWLNR